MKTFDKNHYLIRPVYRKQIVSLYKNKNSPEKIARIVGHKITRHDIEKILNEEGVKRRTLGESMFKGEKIPTKKELEHDRKILKMSTSEMGIKYGKPDKPVSENTVVRWLKNYNLYEGKKPKTEEKIPTKEELEQKLERFPKREIAGQYHKRYTWLLSLIEQYGIEPSAKGVSQKPVYGKPVKEDRPVRQKPEKPEKEIIVKKRKTVLDDYLAREKDVSMENESGFYK